MVRGYYRRPVKIKDLHSSGSAMVMVGLTGSKVTSSQFIANLFRMIFMQNRVMFSHGGEAPHPDEAHCPLRDELCHLHGVSTGEEALRGMLFTGTDRAAAVFHLLLRACTGEMRPSLCRLSL